MTNRKRQDFSEYQYGKKGVLRPKDRFRIRGGPVYVTDSGEKLPMGERGVMVFRSYHEHGAAKRIQAYRADGGGAAILWVGQSMPSPGVPGLHRKPYRVTSKVGETRRTRARRKAAGATTKPSRKGRKDG